MEHLHDTPTQPTLRRTVINLLILVGTTMSAISFFFAPAINPGFRIWAAPSLTGLVVGVLLFVVGTIIRNVALKAWASLLFGVALIIQIVITLIALAQ